MVKRFFAVCAFVLLFFLFTPTSQAQSVCVQDSEKNGTPAWLAEAGCAIEGTLFSIIDAGGDALDWLLSLLWDEFPDWPNMSTIGLTDCSACYMSDLPD